MKLQFDISLEYESIVIPDSSRAPKPRIENVMVPRSSSEKIVEKLEDTDVDKRINKIIEADGKHKSTLDKMNWASNIYQAWLRVQCIDLNNYLWSKEKILNNLPRFILQVRKKSGIFS